MERIRKIIQVVRSVNSITALCNDGTLWDIDHDRKWRLPPEIPQHLKVNLETIAPKAILPFVRYPS